MKKVPSNAQKQHFDEARFAKELQQAKKIYFEKWADEIDCPAIGKKVRVTRAGWDHLVNKKDRTKNQTFFRAKNLEQGKDILERATFFQCMSRYIKASGEEVLYWSFQAVVESRCAIEVIVQQVGNQPPRFWSLVYKGKRPRDLNYEV